MKANEERWIPIRDVTGRLLFKYDLVKNLIYVRSHGIDTFVPLDLVRAKHRRDRAGRQPSK